MAGFFPASKMMVSKAPPSLVPKCGACGLFKTCQSPKLAPAGKGKRKILIITDWPSSDADKTGNAFAGAEMRYLEENLQRAGINLRVDCVISHALICRPQGDASPKALQVDYCRPNINRVIREHNPEIIVPLGSIATQSLLATVFREGQIGEVTKWAGFSIPCQKLNAWICPTFAPGEVMQSDRNPVPALLFRNHLKQVAGIERRPWEVVPDYNKEVECFHNASKAVAAIRGIAAANKPVAFDYEATCLKPEYEGAAIVTCSLSNGDRTIAYPWLGNAVSATQELLRGPLPKIASNLKFEERWTRWAFGKGVRNWAWDTMVAAHLIDNRPETTSIKFQAFIHLGVEAYDEHIKPFLRAKGGKLNQIKSEIDMGQLLLYNGLDSLLEWHVAMIQSKMVGIKI